MSRAVIVAQGGWIKVEHVGALAVDTTMTQISSINGDRTSRPPLNLRQQEALRIATLYGMDSFGISGEAARRDLGGLVSAGLLSRKVARGISCYILT